MYIILKVLRFVANHQEPVFEMIEELLLDKTIKFSMLAGKRPVLNRVRKELVKFWMVEAKKGRSIEEFARSSNDYLKEMVCYKY